MFMVVEKALSDEINDVLTFFSLYRERQQLNMEGNTIIILTVFAVFPGKYQARGQKMTPELARALF